MNMYNLPHSMTHNKRIALATLILLEIERLVDDAIKKLDDRKEND